MTQSSAADTQWPGTREALIPEGWLAIEGLVCGFGDRRAEAPRGTLLLRRQVHGTRIVDAAHELDNLVREATDEFPRVDAEADALVARRPGIVVGARTADCVPLLLVAPRARWAAAVHAGWRGTVAGIASGAVRAAQAAGVNPGELVAALGPSIGPCCYEVSAEVGEEFDRAGLPVLHPRDHGAGGARSAKPHLDLRAANRVLLERAGLVPANIQLVGPCTRCARDRYHSFRAEPASAGRQISWIGWEDRRHAPDRAPIR